MKNSPLYSIGWNDLGKALLIMAGTFTTELSTLPIPSNAAIWIKEIAIAVGSGITYLIKNFFTNSNNKLAQPEIVIPKNIQVPPAQNNPLQ